MSLKTTKYKPDTSFILHIPPFERYKKTKTRLSSFIGHELDILNDRSTYWKEISFLSFYRSVNTKIIYSKIMLRRVQYKIC